MKLPIHIRTSHVSAPQYFGSSEKPNFLFIVILDIDEHLLPLFCIGSRHCVKLCFTDPSLKGKGCNTALQFEITRPFTDWSNSHTFSYRILAEECSGLSVQIDELFINFVLSACLSDNVYVATHLSSGVEAHQREKNETKADFLEV